jgi:TPP-dependent pyruvate/acetoin dehydrogenase alpha subunit
MPDNFSSVFLQVMYERLFRSLYRIRRVEEEVARIYPSDKIKSPIHLSIGQEAVAVGVCEALDRKDIVFGTYRSHASYLAKGGDLKKMIAELYGKATGCAKGKGGSMHLIDVDAGVMGASAVVGSTIPQAVGYAYALKLQNKTAIVAAFFGDGACDEGAFHESLNFAALKRTPLIFICENNLYSILSHQKERHALQDICKRAAAYGIPTERIDDNDCLKIHQRVHEAAQQLREGKPGPFFFECMTYRWMEHVGPNEDYERGYRSKSEAEPWYAGDQVRRIGSLLEPRVRQNIEAEVESEIREAFEFAEASPFPDGEELYTDMCEA